MPVPALRDASKHPLDPTPRFPPLAWRHPVWAWGPLALLLAAGWPILLLRTGPGLGFLIGLGVAGTAALALATVRLMELAGRPPRARRDIVALFLGFGAPIAAGGPFAAAFFSGALGTSGYDEAGAAALWPLGVILGVPIALFAGLIVCAVVFVKPPSAASPPSTGLAQAPARSLDHAAEP
jgi:hypothetical protein